MRGTTLLLALLAFRWGGRRAALWTGALHGLCGLSAILQVRLFDTTLFTFLIILSVERLDRVLKLEDESRQPREIRLVGFVTGLAAITRAYRTATWPPLFTDRIAGNLEHSSTLERFRGSASRLSHVSRTGDGPESLGR